MRLLRCAILALAVVGFGVGLCLRAADTAAPPEGFVSLFNGKDLAGWTVHDGEMGHWKVVDGAIDGDPRREAKGKGDLSLWTEKPYKDFVLLLDWRLKLEPANKNKIPIILPDGSHLKDAKGEEMKMEIDDLDSGVYVRGSSKSQINIWMWPIGSGEVYGYRMDQKMTPEVRAGVTPKKRMDKPRGEWNHFEITMKGDKLSVKLNGEEVIANALLPGVPAEGPIALQDHGRWNEKEKRWGASPSLVQFKNIYIKELK